jgi:hypothetical protein
VGCPREYNIEENGLKWHIMGLDRGYIGGIGRKCGSERSSCPKGETGLRPYWENSDIYTRSFDIQDRSTLKGVQ